MWGTVAWVVNIVNIDVNSVPATQEGLQRETRKPFASSQTEPFYLRPCSEEQHKEMWASAVGCSTRLSFSISRALVTLFLHWMHYAYRLIAVEPTNIKAANCAFTKHLNVRSVRLTLLDISISHHSLKKTCKDVPIPRGSKEVFASLWCARCCSVSLFQGDDTVSTLGALCSMLGQPIRCFWLCLYIMCTDAGAVREGNTSRQLAI